MKLGLTFLFIAISVSSAAITTTTYFKSSDRDHAKKILIEAFGSDDIGNIHYGAVGLKRLKEQIPKSDAQCKIISTSASDPKATAETLYHAAISHKTIANCPQPLPVVNVVKALHAVIAKEANLQELFYATQALTALDQKPLDSTKLLKSVQALLKKNDSLLNFGYFFHISANLNTDSAKAAFNRIEDALVQADEVDAIYLQYEGGLSTTALIVNGIFETAMVVNKSPPLTNEQAVKFANYFLSRSYVQTAKGIANLLKALDNLSTNKIPVAISLTSNPSLPVEQAKIVVKISDVLGNELSPISAIAESVTRVEGGVVIASKKKLTASADKTIFSLDLSEGRPERGKYKISVSATPDKPDPRIPTAANSILNVNVLTNAVIDYIDVGAVDADQTTQGKLSRVPFAKETENPIEADAQQKIQMRFTLKDRATGKLMTVHQAFVRFWKHGSQQSIIFIAEPDSNGQYRIDLDIASKSSDFDFNSGEYNVELVIGDAILSNSFSWKFARFNLKLSGDPKEHSVQSLYKPRPEIQHMFREPEKRPLRFVSDLFSLLAALPLLILLVLWASIRVNVSNIYPSIWTLVFHLSLGGIFVLFGLFWLKFNMFETVRYLLAVGLVTFFSGNKLLRNLSEKK